MMKKDKNNSSTDGPTCGNCIHNPGGHRCCVYPDWAVLPDDPADHCEYHFYRVPPQYMRYYKHKPQAPRGWRWDDHIFAKMLLELNAYYMDVRKGIVSDNNGGYFTRWPFKNQICI